MQTRRAHGPASNPGIDDDPFTTPAVIPNPCPGSWAPAPAGFSEDGIARCPDPGCIAMVGLTTEVFGSLAFGQHVSRPAGRLPGRPGGGHIAACRGADGKVEHCVCQAEVAA